ncbi:LacI family DNA-binding transcriptional regulator [Microbacterium sp. SD291]|uniref:LacI family DNA-binding transcriptional regulator n=1 Tax=Microbacterium sp. SD291 TaxID=2782007 RepID=UPI001A96A40B|nr:LacI family DNA-binding transcriptional regulator [Microbacterium sp. SD291]MBO0979627.1 LacI family DNA-binding transcriptional regulator [Microbacterium sp. SD291]
MVTIADVAQAAGVSISTVSYVMSGKRTISQETKDRVERAVEELDYRPHASARSLASRSTNVIGLQAPLRSGVDVHVVMEIVAGIVREARAHQYDILLLTSDDAEGLRRATGASMVDALLLMDVESDDPRIKTLRKLSAPSVLVGLPQGADGLTCVDFDFEAAGRAAAERLIALGHRRVALIGSPREVLERHTSYAERLSRGFLAACAEHDIPATVHPCPTTHESVAVVDAVLAAHPEVTGVFIHNEGALAHVAARIAALGGRDAIALCPEDIARTVPTLTDSIDLPAEELGSAATRAIIALLAGEPTPKVRLLPPVLASGRPATTA